VKEKDEERGDRERQFNLQRARSISSVYRRGGFSLQRKSHTHLISLPLPLWFSPSPHSLAVLMCLFSSYSPSLITPCFFFVCCCCCCFALRSSIFLGHRRKERRKGGGEGQMSSFCAVSCSHCISSESLALSSSSLFVPGVGEALLFSYIRRTAREDRKKKRERKKKDATATAEAQRTQKENKKSTHMRGEPLEERRACEKSYSLFFIYWCVHLIASSHGELTRKSSKTATKIPHYHMHTHTHKGKKKTRSR
jgi:hypothetical protein